MLLRGLITKEHLYIYNKYISDQFMVAWIRSEQMASNLSVFLEKES